MPNTFAHISDGPRCTSSAVCPPRLPYHFNNDIVRRGGVIWVEFWEAANGTSVGWSHLRKWLHNPNEREIIECKCAQLYGVNSKCIARHTNWGLSSKDLQL